MNKLKSDARRTALTSRTSRSSSPGDGKSRSARCHSRHRWNALNHQVRNFNCSRRWKHNRCAMIYPTGSRPENVFHPVILNEDCSRLWGDHSLPRLLHQRDTAVTHQSGRLAFRSSRFRSRLLNASLFCGAPILLHYPRAPLNN